MTPLRRNYVILRLNAFLSDGANRFDSEPNILTIEHVLPQTIKAGSEWERVWPDSDIRDIWLNRISNLVPLTRKKNSAAQNYDFEKKKKTYFSTANGVTTYPLTTQVILEEKWTPEVLERRQEELRKKFSESWDLDYAPQDTGIKNDTIIPYSDRKTKEIVDLTREDESTTRTQKNCVMSQDIFSKLQANGRGKDKFIKKLFEEWHIGYDNNLNFSKYTIGSKYYWMEPSVDILSKDWSIVLFNAYTLMMTVFRIPKDTLSVNSNEGFKIRNDTSKQNRLKLEFLDGSFIEKQSKVDFSIFITNVIKVQIV